MKSCPQCKGRATKLVSISTGVTTCQQCGHQYSVDAPEPKKLKVRTKLPKTGELSDRAILGGEPSL